MIRSADPATGGGGIAQKVGMGAGLRSTPDEIRAGSSRDVVVLVGCCADRLFRPRIVQGCSWVVTIPGDMCRRDRRECNRLSSYTVRDMDCD